ncbi:MAG: hypothetical protein QM500_17470 [Methylococcales bacterium]
MSRSTPWGSAQHVTNHLRGFSTVQTAGHGGMMVSKGAAEKSLSEAARKRACFENGYYCYEEDSDYLIPLFDAKALRPELMKGSTFWEAKTPEEIEDYLIKSLSGSHPDYLLEVGVEPDAEVYKKWKLRETANMELSNGSPNYVMSCIGDYTTLILGVLVVSTADNQTHYVTEASYNAMCDDPYKSIIRPFSDLEVVDMSIYPSMTLRFKDYALAIAKPYVEQVESNHANAIKELEGRCYGPRSRFNGSLETAKEHFIRHLVKEGKSQREVDSILVEKLNEVHDEIHPEFREVNIFEALKIKDAA